MSRTEFRVEAGAWREDGEAIDEAISAAMAAAWQPYTSLLEGIDPTSRESGLAFLPAQLAETEAWLTAWADDSTIEWITPGSPNRREGIDVRQGQSA